VDEDHQRDHRRLLEPAQQSQKEKQVGEDGETGGDRQGQPLDAALQLEPQRPRREPPRRPSRGGEQEQGEQVGQDEGDQVDRRAPLSS
jgi:hypothetical protein